MWSCQSSLITPTREERLTRRQGIMGNSDVPCSCSARARCALPRVPCFPICNSAWDEANSKSPVEKHAKQGPRRFETWAGGFKSGTLHLPSKCSNLNSCLSMFFMQFIFFFISADKLCKAVRVHLMSCHCYDICDRQIFLTHENVNTVSIKLSIKNWWLAGCDG